mgnify:FL=1
MALSKVNFNSMNVTPSASKAIKFNSSNNGLETGDIGGSLVLLETQTLSSAAGTVDFTSSIDSTYKEYMFKFYDVHPATDDQALAFQVDTGTNTSYNQTITSTFFNAQHDESDSNTYLMYRTTGDQAQGSSFQRLTEGSGNDNDQSCTGTLHLFTPSDTTFVKHFIAHTHNAHQGDYAMNNFIAGYVNTTTALTRVRFKFESGNIDSGTFKLYGVS